MGAFSVAIDRVKLCLYKETSVALNTRNQQDSGKAGRGCVLLITPLVISAMNTEYQLIEYQLLLVVSRLCSKICQLCYAALLQYFTYYAQQFPYYAKNYACFMVNLSTLCFDDCTWFFIMLSFSDSSSRQAEQNSFPADTVTITSESCSLCSTNSLWIGRASWLQSSFVRRYMWWFIGSRSPYACTSSPIVWEL